MSKKEKITEETPDQKKIAVIKTPTQNVVGVFIYVGPTTKKLTRYASFTDGLPLHMNDQFEQCPALKKMFIPIDRFTEFEQRVKDKSTVESLLFHKVLDYFKGAEG